MSTEVLFWGKKHLNLFMCKYKQLEGTTVLSDDIDSAGWKN